MRSVIESEMPLIVAIQHSKSGMFSKFHFTCFEWIIHGKLFRSPSFNLKNLCAAGTEEGPILLISKLTQSIVPVCLLCVHKRKVTDIAMSHQINTFLSVSTDGSVAGWHCSDGSCCFVYDNLLPPGEIKIVLCDSNASLAWFWTRGESASLVDLKRGTVAQKIDYVGISSFSILKKHSNFMSNSNNQSSTQKHVQQPSFAIMAGINTVRTYQIDEKTNFLKLKKEEKILFSLGQRYFVTSNGIVTVKNKFIKIFLPNLEIPIYTENITEMSDDDMISTVSWRNPETFIISTFKGFIKIYKIQILKTESSQRISIQKMNYFSCPDCCIFTNIAFNSDIGSFIFAATSYPKKSKKSKKFSVNQSTVMCLSISDQKVVKLVIPQIDKICCIPDPKSRITIQAEQHSTTFQIFDWGSSTSIVQTISNNNNNTSNLNENNISINSSEYKSTISRSFIGPNSVSVNQSLKSICSSSEVRNYSLFGKQLPLSQSVDFRPNVSSSFFLREGSIGSAIKTSYITAITCQNFNNLASRLQIIVGTSDGKLYFFWENNLLPFEVSEALISPIVSIVLLPMKFAKSSCLIAIGKDSSFCLFRWNKLSHRYVTNYLPIVALGIIETQKLIVVQKSDNSFSVYNMKSPEPIAVMLIQPPGTVFIWSKVKFSQPAGIQSTLSIEIFGSSLFYSVLEVSKLRKCKVQRRISNRIPVPKSGTVEMSPLINQQQQQENQDSQQSSKISQISKFTTNLEKSSSTNDNDSNNLKEKSKENINSKSPIDLNLANSSTNSTNSNEKSKENVDLTSSNTNANNSTNSNDNSKENINSKSPIDLNSTSSNTNDSTDSNEKSNKNADDNLNDKISFNSASIENSNSNSEIKTANKTNDSKTTEIINTTANHKSSSNPNFNNQNSTEPKSKSNSIPKSGSNTNLYSEYPDLVRKVNTDSNSDSNQNSDSATEFYTNASPTSQNAPIPTGTIIPNPLEPSSINDDENGKENDSGNLNDLLPLRGPTVSENFEDSLVNLSFNSVISDAQKSDSQFEFEGQKIDQSKVKQGIIANLGPINRSGKFTLTGIKNLVSLILEMMVPSTTTTTSSSNEYQNLKQNFDEMVNYSPGMIENSKRFTSIDDSKDNLSFVLVGHKNRPTFFYPMFKLSGPTVFDTSPFNAALHYLSYKLMSNFLNLIRNTEKFEKENKFKICGFISILTQLLFINDPEIQRISALTCNKIVNWSSSGIVVPEHVWNLLAATYIHYFDKNDVADYDKFLMAIMMVTHSDLVDQIYHNIVFDFLKKTAQEKCPSNFLAFNILLANFDFWAEFYGDDQKGKNKGEIDDNSKINKKGKKELMVFLLNSFFKYDNDEKELVKEKFYSIIKENFNSFCESIRFIIPNRPNQNVPVQTCEICSELAEEHPTSIGSLGPLFIAYLANDFSQLQEVFYANLKEMQKKFKKEIVNLDQIWLFASNDGFIHVFKNMKLFFKEKISEGPILLVSIGPGAVCAAAVTKSDPTLVKIDLKSSFFLSLNKKRIIEKSKIDVKNGLPFENLDIVWDNKESCHIEYY